ncbi:amidohydrolase [Brochothrix campestris]|uniref:Carboxypeptidase n=1 Tax=Brochothrix campestris FSL F6-1037 TaxID=1265861 RepID=W7D129_9LIST|nr:amidohydrolase [Brochothrix campestris]EUJ38988.1 carboxypeptidase [Brochothrix campestris FSL F6-1037]
MRARLMSMLEQREAEMIQIRRHLHQYPEVSFEEVETARYIRDFYEGKDVKIDSEVGGGHGVVVTINPENTGKTIALRADFDALPIEEETGLPFASKNKGVMHACGHDAHTAYLLVLADCLIELKDEIPGTIKIVHQHAEEKPPGGAKDILASGLLDDVDKIYGIHVMPGMPAGVVAYCGGKAMAGRNYFNLKIRGKGGHGSSPHLSHDSIVAGSYFVTQIQTVISRCVNPIELGVVTIGSFAGEGTFNIIKDSVTLEGDVRFIKPEVRDRIQAEIKALVKGLELSFHVSCELDYKDDYPVLYNDPVVMDEVVGYLEKGKADYITALAEVPVVSGSEDFAFYTEKIPGVFLYIGAQPAGQTELIYNHNPRFDIDEASILVSAKTVADIVLGFYQPEV